MNPISAFIGAAHYSQPSTATTRTDSSAFSDIYKASGADQLIQDLQEKYGIGVGVQNVAKDDTSIEKYVLGSGAKELTLAPNIVDRMVSDPGYRQNIEGKIGDYLEEKSVLPEQMAANGRVLLGSGMIVHEDGTSTTWVFSDESPETKARVRAENEAKAQAKAERRQEYVEQSQEAHEKRVELRRASESKTDKPSFAGWADMDTLAAWLSR